MRDFREQFVECRGNGTCIDGPPLMFKDHPELLPHPISKAARNLAKILETNPDASITLLQCTKFGGNCNSGQPDCKKMRQNFLDEKLSSL